MRRQFTLAFAAAGLASVAGAQVTQFSGPSPNLTTVLDFDNPFVASGPINPTDPAITSTGIASINLIGGTFAALGDTLTGASNVMGQGLISVNGVLSVGGVGEPLDNTGALGGWEIVLAAPVNEFQCLFIDQAGMIYDIELLLGGVSIGTGSFTYPNVFPSPPSYWRGTGDFDTVRFVFPQNVGVGLDEFAFGNVAPPPPPGPITMIDTAPGTYMDISATGTPLSLADDGEVDILTTVGNHVLAAGTARVGSNGAVRFHGAGAALGFTNEAIPSAAAFSGDQTLMPFWDDVNTSNGTNGEIYWQEIGGLLIIQWEAVEFFGGPAGDTASFQIQVVPGTGPMVAQYLYQSVDSGRADNGGSATIGFQGGASGWSDFEWGFNLPGQVANGDVLTILAAPGQIGTNYCMANQNSTGTTGVMAASGSANVVLNDLTLVGTDLPANAFAFFIVSDVQGFVPNPGGSSGNLCLGGQIGRYVGAGQIQNTGGNGEATLLIDNQQIPSPTGFFGVAPGDVLNFQCWHRDAGMPATSNFTDGLEVTFN